MTRSHRTFVLGASFLVLALMATPTARAAGCHTSCNLTVPPDCLGCGFVMFSYITCVRLGCNLCEEDSCSVLLPSQADRLAAGAADGSAGPACKASAEHKPAPVRVLRVQTLAARS